MKTSEAIGRSGVAILLTLAALVLAGPSAARAKAAGWTRPAILDAGDFPLPASLEPNVAFWTTVYAVYDSKRSLFHDNLYLDIIYEVLDFSDLEKLPETRKRLLRRQGITEAEARWGQVLRDMAAGTRNETQAAVYARVEAMFRNVPGGREKYIEAIDRFRSQRCLRDEFAAGIVRSGRYMAGIETIFARHGLPKALTRIPFVESMFQLGARSSVAAAGVWQFMPSTARRFLRMDLEVDERFDPWRAADAAAIHFADSYQRLGVWPLAVTAYNHGPYGMVRAVSQVGSRDIGDIVARYRSRTFGFASRNFYTEFIAAVTVYEERAQRFPGVTPDPALEHEIYTPSHYVSANALADAAGIDRAMLQALNPGFDRRIWSGELLLPRGYALRVPSGHGARTHAAFSSLEAEHRREHQLGRTYQVRSGDTLARIAGRFGSSVGAIQRANGLHSAHLIRVGQVLRIPSGSGDETRVASRSSATPSPPPAAAKAATYTVRSGDTLSTIAEANGSSVRAIQSANQLASTHHIAVGQRLAIPAGDKVTHVVQRGDTLTKIAQRYGISVDALKRHNALRSSTIHPRQVLHIP